MKTRLLLASTLSVMLTACGSGGGGGSDAATERPSGEARGIAQHGPVRNANISAYDWSTGSKGRFINSTQSDDLGEYSLSIQHADAPILISSNGGDYTEESNSRSVSMGNDELMAIQFYESGNTVDAQLTFFTTVSACLAGKLVADGVTVGNAINEANSKLSAIVGVDIMNTKPIDPTLDASFTAFMTPGHSYGLAVAGISQAVETLRLLNGVTDTNNPIFTSKYFTNLACRDIAEDKLLNGLAAPTAGNASGQLYVGSVPITTETYRRGIPIGILDFAANANNKTGLTAQGVLEIANNISISASEIFGGAEGQPVDVTGPSIVSFTAEGTLFAGTIDLNFDIQDPLSVKTITFYLDGDLFANAQPDDQVMRINTALYGDGEHIVRVVATDILDNPSESEFTFRFINSGAGVSFTSPTLVNNKDYSATGTFVDNGAGVDKIVINGEDAAIDTENKTWEIGITLIGGENQVQAIIYDSLGNSTDIKYIVNVDSFSPVLSSWDMSASFTNYNGQINLCEAGDVNESTSPSRPICLNAERVSLEGAKVSGSLTNDDFIVLGMDLNDPKGQGVFSDVENISLEYRIKLNGTVTVDWSSVVRPDPTFRLSYLPVTTEFFGEDFYKVSHDDQFEAEIRAFDEAGNSDIVKFNFSLDVLTPAIEVSAVIENESIFSTPYSSRQALNQETVKVEYTYNNSSSLPYLIALSSNNNHMVSQEIEGAMRVNQYRESAVGLWETRRVIPVTYSYTPVFTGGTVYVAAGTVLVEQGVTDTLRRYGEGFTLYDAELSHDIKYTDYMNGYTDVVEASNAEEVDEPALSCDDNALFLFGIKSNYLNTDSDSSSSGVAYCFEHWVDGKLKQYSKTQLRYTFSEVEYLDGFPKNNFSEYSKQHAVSDTELKVIDKTNGIEIFPIDGWYRIPASTDVLIVAETQLPFIENKVDTRVGDDSINMPYDEEVFQDKLITWDIDTDLEISRAIDPGGDISDLGSISSTVTVEGLGVKTYIIAR